MMSAFAAISSFNYVNILEKSSLQRQVYTFGIMQNVTILMVLYTMHTIFVRFRYE